MIDHLNGAVNLEQLVLKGHVRLGLKSNTGPEDVGQSATLLGQGVDDGSTRGRERRLQHVAEDAQDAVEAAIVLGGGTVGRAGSPLDASHHLRHDHQVNDQWGGKQRILTDVEDGNGLVAAHENLGIVLVQGTLVVADSRHVLDDNSVIGVLALLVQDRVGFNHVIDNIGLGDLLGSELLVGAQVLAVVVAQVVVRRDGRELDTGIDQEIDQGRLHLGLTRLEIVAANKRTMLLGKLNGTRNKGVLRRTVDEGCILQDTSNGENSRRRDLFVPVVDSLEQVVGGIIDTRDNIGVSLRVGGPENNDLVQRVGGLEVLDILSNLLNVGSTSLGAGNDIVGSVLLVGSNEIGIVDGWQGDHVGHLLLDLGLESRLQNCSSVHSIG